MNFLIALTIPATFTAAILFYLQFKFNIVSWKLLTQAILFGLLTIIPLLILDQIAVIRGIDELRNLKRTGFYSFVVVGFGAELGKFVLLRYYFLKQKSFKGPLDGIIYALIISGSYTFVALPLFMSGWFSRAMDLTFLLTYTIANLSFAMIMGFFTGMGKFRHNRFIDSMTALGAASFFHGFYYFINLTDEYLIFGLYGAGLITIALMLLVKASNLKNEDKAKD